MKLLLQFLIKLLIKKDKSVLYFSLNMFFFQNIFNKHFFKFSITKIIHLPIYFYLSFFRKYNKDFIKALTPSLFMYKLTTYSQLWNRLFKFKINY